MTLTASQLAGFSTIDLGGGTDVLNVVASGDISALGTPTISNVETGNLTGTTGNDTVTMSAEQWTEFGNSIDLGGGTDVLNVKVAGNVDMSADGAPASIAHVETGNLIGSTGTDTVTLTGEQLDAIIQGDGNDRSRRSYGDGDTINLKSTSADLNTLGADDAKIQWRRGDLGVGRRGRP